MSKPVSPIRVMMRMTKVWKGMYWLNLALWAGFHLLPVYLGLAVGRVFDGLEINDEAAVRSALLLYLVVIVGRLAMFQGGILLYARFWHRMVLLIRRNMLGWLMEAPGSRILPMSTGAAVSTFREDTDGMAEYVENWMDIVGLVGFLSSVIYILWNLSPTLTTWLMLPLILAAGVTQMLALTIRRYRERLRSTTESVTGFIGDFFTAIESVKATGTAGPMLNHLEHLNEDRQKAALADTFLGQVIRSMHRNMANVAIGIVLLAGASSISAGELSLGALTTFLFYIPRLTSYMAWGGEIIAQHARAKVATERMMRLMVDAPATQITDPTPLDLDGTGATKAPLDLAESDRLKNLRVRGLSFAYPDGQGQGIQDISFDVPRGSFTVVTGRIGAGKTTLVRVLLGLLPSHDGEIAWNEELVDDPSIFLVPPRSAYTPQVPTLVSDSLRANITMGRNVEDTQLDEIIELARLGSDLGHLESGLDTLVGTRGARLSGGQVQRSAAARMFATDADLLVFDDLSSALDVRTEAEIWKRLFELRDVTCLVVSHRHPALLRADNILLMKDGQLHDQGTLQELLERSEEMRALWSEDLDLW